MILVAGESLVDVLLEADTRHDAPGGSALNVAVAAARLDAPVALLTELGDDDAGALLRAHAGEAGVELEADPVARTSSATATLDATGAAAYSFDLTWSLRPRELPACDVLHVGGLGTLLEPGETTVLDLVDQAFARDVPISYDPNIRPELHEDPARAWPEVESLADRCRLVHLSRADVAWLHPGADPGDIAASLLAGDQTELVLVTDGPRPAAAYADGAAVSLQPPPVQVTDSIGAGDAFTGAVLAVLLDDDAFAPHGTGLPTQPPALERLLRAATAVATLSCARRGAQPPWRSDLPAGWPG